MRKIVGGLFLAVATLAPAGASAQVGTVNATATIVGQITVTNEGDLHFGAIVPGNGAVVTPGGALGTGQTLGHLRVEHSSNFTVSSTPPTQLSSGTDVIDVSFQCGYSATAGGATAGVSACGSVPARTGVTAGTPTVTYLEVGGTILAGDTSGKAAGTYTATVQFTFTPTI